MRVGSPREPCQRLEAVHVDPLGLNEEPLRGPPAFRIVLNRALYAVIVAAVLLRVAFSLGIGQGIQNLAPEEGVGEATHQIAESLNSGHGYRTAPDAPPSTRQEPAYPIFLFLLFKVFGVRYLAIQIVQALLGGLACWLVYRFGRWILSEELGLAAAGLFAVYPIAIEGSARLDPANLAVPIALLLAWALARALREGHPFLGLFAGALWGIAVLTSGSFVAFPVAVLLGTVLFRSLRRPAGTWLRWAVPAAVAGGIVLAPWVIRNERLAGEPVPGTTAGWASYYRGLACARRMLAWDDLQSVQKKAANRITEEVAGRCYRGDPSRSARTAAEAAAEDRVARDLALAELRRDPIGALARGILGIPFSWFMTLGPRKRIVSLVIHLPLLLLFIAGVRRLKRAEPDAFDRATVPLLLVLYLSLVQGFLFPLVRKTAPAIAISFLFSALPVLSAIRKPAETRKRAARPARSRSSRSRSRR